MANKNLFIIPKTRLVRVEYWREGVKYACTIPNPRDNNNLEVALLAKGLPIKQISIASVSPVQETRGEIKTTFPGFEHTVESECARVSVREISPHTF